MTFKPTAPFAAVLHAPVVPPSGGDTLWSSLYAAYDGLSSEMQTRLAGLTAIHDMGSFRNDYAGKDMAGLNDAMQRIGSAEHPVVRHHPATGRPFLFVNQSFTRQIGGLSIQESDRTLQFLFDHMNRPGYQVRFRWKVNALAMWDNRVTMHYAVDDYLPHYRRMHRVQILDDRRV
jgi:taurine dioxygenase